MCALVSLQALSSLRAAGQSAVEEYRLKAAFLFHFAQFVEWPSNSSNVPGGPIRVTLRDHFDNLKGWISGAYYSSEVGMRELGWTGQVMFESFPGCEHPDGHQ